MTRERTLSATADIVTVSLSLPADHLTLTDSVTVYDLSPEASFQVVQLPDGRHGWVKLRDLAPLLFGDAA